MHPLSQSSERANAPVSAARPTSLAPPPTGARARSTGGFDTA
jgi:hypothetical protein